MIEPKSTFHIQDIIDNGKWVVTAIICDDAIANAVAELNYVLEVQSPVSSSRIVIFNPTYAIEDIRIEFPQDVAHIANAARLLGDGDA